MSHESRLVDAADAWTEAGLRLLRYDPGKFEQMLSIARAFVALYERGVEDAEIFRSRMDQILKRRQKVVS